MPRVGDELLHRGYRLEELLDESGDRQTWRAHNSYGNPVLIKTWQFAGASPDPVLRALFNTELRNLFRLSGLPGVEKCIVTILDAGVMEPTDDRVGCFVIVLDVPGFLTLAQALANRQQHRWLRELDVVTNRTIVWRSFRRLAQGLGQIHRCQMLHRAVSPRAIFLDEGAFDDMRLGAFEWTVRLTNSDMAVEPVVGGDASTPYSFEYDWYCFGVVLAQVLAAADIGGYSGADANQRLLDAVHRSPLHDIEQETIIQFLAADRESRQNRSSFVLPQLDEVIETLEQPRQKNAAFVLICALGPQTRLTTAVLDEMKSVDPASDVKAHQLQPQCDFIKDDLAQATIVRRANVGDFVLIGRKLRYRVKSHKDRQTSRADWSAAFCEKTVNVPYAGTDEQRDLSDVPIDVLSVAHFYQGGQNLERATNWRSILPLEEANESQALLVRYQEFFRVTNQIEMLMVSAQIFAYKVVDYTEKDGKEYLEIVETPEERPFPDYLKRQDMITMLAHELALGRAEKVANKRGQQDRDLVYLSEEDSLALYRQARSFEMWSIQRCKPGTPLRLERMKNAKVPRPPDEGFLRTSGMFGQVHLLIRRKRAIDRLLDHAHLLRSFLTPDDKAIASKAEKLPSEVNEGLSRDSQLDDTKVAAIEDIWQTRPLFLLQGPPGTGKTTLVANLLRLIFDESPVTQVLVTAQAHPAVDVLRRRVNDALGDASDPLRHPLSVRFPKSLRKQKADEGDGRPIVPDADFPDAVARRVLEEAKETLDASPTLSALQQRWRNRIDDILAGLASGDEAGEVTDFIELIKRSANITYSSTTSGALAELAESPLSFDWSIIEEAGKAHGFDLVLPLQNAHRWLMIGDHEQLPPYRFKNFRKAIENIDEVFDLLSRFPDRGRKLLDVDLLNAWTKDADEDPGVENKRAEKVAFWQKRLKVFKDIYERAKESMEGRSDEHPPLHGRLTEQHRMHPTIAGLISYGFYDNQIVSRTVDDHDKPLDRVCHNFVAPEDIIGKAIVWIDVPRGDTNEGGDQTEYGMYTSDAEIDAIDRFLSRLRLEEPVTKKLDLALLSPYRAQMGQMKQRFSDLHLREWNWLAPSNRSIAHTVDSFQGNEAGVVVVSMVRNNRCESLMGAFGFLTEPERMNVLLSRAERLLVLVGCWEFFHDNLADITRAFESTNDLSKLARVVDYLEKCFNNGDAAFIPANTLTER